MLPFGVWSLPAFLQEALYVLDLGFQLSQLLPCDEPGARKQEGQGVDGWTNRG